MDNLYKEALERARKVYNSEAASPARKQMLAGIFPELAESEDERITRAINNMLPFIPDEAYANNGVTKEGVLNWLERQKEQKPAEWLVELGFEQNGYDPVQVLKTIKEKHPMAWEKVLHQEWSEEDEAYLADALWCVEQAEKSCKDEDDKGACWSARRWLKALKNRGNFPKSNTNSPSERSEEDELKLRLCVEALDVGQTKRHIYEHGITPDGLKVWLKSLRPQPHWKPSEEQMAGLLAVINSPANAGSETCQLALRSLYENLKKL